MNDREIIALLYQRDEAAVKAIRERFGGLCYSIVLNIISDRRDAEECVSNVYFKLWSNIPPAEPKDLTAYVAKTARNEALMRYRSNASQRNPAASEPIEELEACFNVNSSIEAELNARAIAKAVESFVSRIPQEQRTVFMRRYWFFDSAKTIAEVLGTTEKRVNTLLAKTRRQLRSYLIKEGYING